LKDFRGAEVLPGPGVETAAEIDGFIRARANTAYHPSGTCRMGSDDASVVDPQCRVRGVSGLRVADASIMPSIVTGNLNVPTMMIGEKVSDLIAGKSLPPAVPAKPFIAADWRQTQR
jgi:choline dehydrogenase